MPQLRALDRQQSLNNGNKWSCWVETELRAEQSKDSSNGWTRKTKAGASGEAPLTLSTWIGFRTGAIATLCIGRLHILLLFFVVLVQLYTRRPSSHLLQALHALYRPIHIVYARYAHHVRRHLRNEPPFWYGTSYRLSTTTRPHVPRPSFCTTPVSAAISDDPLPPPPAATDPELVLGHAVPRRLRVPVLPPDARTNGAQAHPAEARRPPPSRRPHLYRSDWAPRALPALDRALITATGYY